MGALDRSVYSDWTRLDGADRVSRFFQSRACEGVVYVAAGLTDPRLPPEDHESVNVRLPRNVIVGATRVGFKVVTFGTVMEKIVGSHSVNAYLQSKVRFAKYLEDTNTDNPNMLHIRIHTLYGGRPPDAHMFLGQLLNAIESGGRFEMSAGDQLREYHHVDDETAAVAALVRSGIHGTVDLSHGAPIRLRDLARSVCEKFGNLDRLDIGVLPRSPYDNFSRVFERMDLLKGCTFRETLPSVFEYMKTCIETAKAI